MTYREWSQKLPVNERNTNEAVVCLTCDDGNFQFSARALTGIWLLTVWFHNKLKTVQGVIDHSEAVGQADIWTLDNKVLLGDLATVIKTKENAYHNFHIFDHN